jgi:hypothetical protein
MTAPSVMVMGATAALQRDDLSGALSLMRKARAQAQSVGRDTADLDLRLRLLEELKRALAGRKPRHLNAWLVQRSGPVPFAVFRPELL